MESKYYVPDKKEFHIGFEYEMFNRCSWMELNVLTGDDIHLIETYELPENTIRVKYLDRQDIESFGLKVEKDDEYAGEYYFSKENSIIGKFLTEDKKYNIEMLSTYFIVKNKSEFKKLLIQLEIINE